MDDAQQKEQQQCHFVNMDTGKKNLNGYNKARVHRYSRRHFSFNIHCRATENLADFETLVCLYLNPQNQGYAVDRDSFKDQKGSCVSSEYYCPWWR